MWHWGDVPPFFINLLVILNNPFEILFDVKTRLSSILLINIFNLNNYFLLFNINFIVNNIFFFLLCLVVFIHFSNFINKNNKQKMLYV